MAETPDNPHEGPSWREDPLENTPVVRGAFPPNRPLAPVRLERIEAPFTPEQVVALNHYQRHGLLHPFTCGGDREDVAHKRYAREHGDSDTGLLVAATAGWHCPACAYRQNWAHAFMATARAAS